MGEGNSEDFFNEFDKKPKENKNKNMEKNDLEDEDEAKESAQNIPQKRSIGSILREERNRKDLTLDEVSSVLYISQKYLEYMENNEFDKFYAETYLLGFIRKYSSYLGLNPDEILNIYYESVGRKKTDSYENSSVNNSDIRYDPINMGNGSRLPIILISVIIVFLVLALGFYFWNMSLDSRNSQVDSEEEVMTLVEIRNESIDGSFSRQEEIIIRDKDNKEYSFDIAHISEDSIEVEFENGRYLIYEDFPRSVVAQDDEREFLIKLNGTSEDIADLEINFKEDIDLALQEDLSLEGQGDIIDENVDGLARIALEVVLQGDTYFRYSSDDREVQTQYYNGYARFFIEATDKISIYSSNANATSIFYEQQRLPLNNSFISTKEIEIKREGNRAIVYSKDIV